MECPLHALQWISEPHDFRSTGNRKKRTKERWNCTQYNLPEVTALRQIKSDRMTNTKKSSGIRAELWLMKPLSASPAKQMHKKTLLQLCAVYTGTTWSQTCPDWLTVSQGRSSTQSLCWVQCPRTNHFSENAESPQLKSMPAAVTLISLGSPSLQSGYNCIFKVFTKPIP